MRRLFQRRRTPDLIDDFAEIEGAPLMEVLEQAELALMLCSNEHDKRQLLGAIGHALGCIRAAQAIEREKIKREL